MAGLEAVNGNYSYYGNRSVDQSTEAKERRLKELLKYYEVKAKHKNTTEKPQQTQEVQETTTAQKVGIGTMILSGLAIGADILFCKGKHLKQIATKTKNFLKGGTSNTISADLKPMSRNILPLKTPTVKNFEPYVINPQTVQPETIKPVVVKQGVVPKVQPTVEPPVEPKIVGLKDIKIETPEIIEAKVQAQKEIEELTKNIQNMTRGEIAKERFALNTWGNEISRLERKAKSCVLSEPEKIRLDFLKHKREILEVREQEIVKSLEKYVPTVSDKSAVSMHHEINGYNTRVRETVHAKAKGLTGLEPEALADIEKTEKLMAKIDQEFANLPPLEKPCIVYRGRAENPVISRLNGDFSTMEKVKVGDRVVPDEAYSYTAFKRDIAEVWCQGGRMSDLEGKQLRTIMYEIHLPKGAKVSRNMEHSGEVVMPRGAEYIVKDKRVDNEGCMEVVLEYVLPKA